MTDRPTYWLTDLSVDGWTKKQTNWQTHGQTDKIQIRRRKELLRIPRHTDWLTVDGPKDQTTNWPTNWLTDLSVDRWTNTQTKWQTDKLTERQPNELVQIRTYSVWLNPFMEKKTIFSSFFSKKQKTIRITHSSIVPKNSTEKMWRIFYSFSVFWTLFRFL